MAKNLLLWLVIAAVLLTVFNNFTVQPTSEQLNYSQVIEEVQLDRVTRVMIDGLTITGTRLDNSSFESILPRLDDRKLIDDLLVHRVQVAFSDTHLTLPTLPPSGSSAVA